jgi:UDP-GlcNAc:undecaprenyl-phosphate GlcNAc-1-phosphate transferase
VLYPTLTGRNPTYLPFGIIALGIVLFTVLHPSVRARRRETGRPADGALTPEQSAETSSERSPEQETLAEGLPPAGSAH